MTTSPVLFSTVTLQNGKSVGHAQLNLPGSLNALNLEMVQLLKEKLLYWQQDENVLAVILSGAGEKAFCAGGDVVSLYNAMLESPGKTPESVETFFTQEYQLDYLIHRYKKPLIVWGNGFIMGGGIGLFAGAKYRVVTETSRLAMPEVNIGLFPDVGGSYFLNQLSGNIGLFLGLTGVQFNGSDAKYVGLATHAVAGKSVDSFLDTLGKLQISGNIDNDLLNILEDMDKRSVNDLPSSNIEQHYDTLLKALDHEKLSDVISSVAQWQNSDDKWLSRAAKNMLKGSPITHRLVYEQLKSGKDKSLAECFRMELIMACRCGAAGEFQEGVRALLIEKDGEPEWLYEDQRDIPDSFIESFFTNQWDDESHPLAKLGA